jgi:hypothetical protein
LSSSIALETFALIPALAKQIGDDELFTAILRLAAEIANRSAKHSADFLQKTPRVAETLKASAAINPKYPSRSSRWRRILPIELAE